MFYLLTDGAITISARGARHLTIAGYKFRPHPNYRIGQKTRWVCLTQQRTGCRAVAYTIDDEVISIKNDHLHPPM